MVAIHYALQCGLKIMFCSHSLASKSGTSPSLSTQTTHCPSDTHSQVVADADKSLLTGADSDSVCTGLAGRGDGMTDEGARSSLVGKLAITAAFSSIHTVTA